MLSSKEKHYSNSGNEKILSLIRIPNSTILDVGCGGGNAKALHKASHTLDGITISEQEKAESSNFFRSIVIYNIEQGLPSEYMSNKYDYVLCSHVLEHICYPNKVINDIKKTLKDDGTFIVALPNIMHYKSRISLFMGNFDYQETGIWDYTHFRWYTFKTARKLIESHGFKIVQ